RFLPDHGLRPIGSSRYAVDCFLWYSVSLNFALKGRGFSHAIKLTIPVAGKCQSCGSMSQRKWMSRGLSSNSARNSFSPLRIKILATWHNSFVPSATMEVEKKQKSSRRIEGFLFWADQDGYCVSHSFSIFFV